MKTFRGHYANYQKQSSDSTPIPENSIDLFTEWALNFCEHCDEDLHQGKYNPKDLDLKTLIKTAPSKDVFLKNFIPSFLTNRWPIRFNSKNLT